MTIRPPLFVFVASLFLNTACTVQPKLPMPKNNPPLAAVQAEPAAYKNRVVTWGGVIIQTEVKKKQTWITLLAKPLDSSAEPRLVEHSLGRFLAVFEGFHDPAVFAQDRFLTVTGPVQGSEKRKIGELSYTYPVVKADRFYLWPVRYRSDWDDYYDGWYDPWYPYGYPYWYPRSHLYLHHRYYVE